MINSEDLCVFVIQPVLKLMGLYSLSAEQLLLLTYQYESICADETRLKQVWGPALGIYQCEPSTHRDIYLNYLNSRDDLRSKVVAFCSLYHADRHDNIPDLQELQWNLAYATAICRVHYLRVRDPLPEQGEWSGMFHYWSQYYRTSQKSIDGDSIGD